MRRHWRILLLGIIISGAAIAAIAAQIDLDLLMDALRNANYWVLIPAALLAVLGLVARAVRWRVLLSGQLPYGRSFHILNIAYLLNGLLPLRIGEVARAWLASRGERSVPFMQSAATIVVERVLDLLTVVVFIAIGLVIAVDQVPVELRATGLFTGVVATVGFLFLVFLAGRRRLAQVILSWWVARLPVLGRLNLAAWLDNLLDGLAPLTRLSSLMNALLWTAISWAFSFASGYVTMYVFYEAADAVATFLFIAAASFAVAFPAIPGNVGPYEWSIIAAMTPLGYTATDAGFATTTAFAFTVHFVNLAVNAVLGVIGFVYEGVSLGQISAGVQRARQATAPAVGQTTTEEESA